MTDSQRGFVLVVEDNIAVQRVLQMMLARNGFSPLTATRTQDAMKCASDHMAAAFILDLTLANGDSGLDVLAWLRLQPHYRETPAIILTGHTELPEEQEDAIRRHGAYVFYKPERFELLIDHLWRVLGHRAQ